MLGHTGKPQGTSGHHRAHRGPQGVIGRPVSANQGPPFVGTKGEKVRGGAAPQHQHGPESARSSISGPAHFGLVVDMNKSAGRGGLPDLYTGNSAAGTAALAAALAHDTTLSGCWAGWQDAVWLNGRPQHNPIPRTWVSSVSSFYCGNFAASWGVAGHHDSILPKDRMASLAGGMWRSAKLGQTRYQIRFAVCW